jgi:hypothetical protein
MAKPDTSTRVAPFTVEPRFDAMHPEWSAFPRGWLVRIRKALEGRPAGYIDKTGSWIIPPRYKSISSFPFTVLAAVTQEGEPGSRYIDHSGHRVLKVSPGSGACDLEERRSGPSR